LHKEPSLKARLELFATNITVLEMRWQHVPNLGVPRRGNCADHNARSEYVVYNHVIAVSRAKPSRERKGTETIGEQMSLKYAGDRPWIQSYVISAILYVMR